MTSSLIISLFSVVMIITGSGISFITVTNNASRRLLKVAISFAALIGCLAFIISTMKPTPYIPEYNPIVYVTDYGECYHIEGCGYLRSKNEMHLYDAVMEDYVQCSRCDPPAFPHREMRKIEKSLELDGPDLIEFCTSFDFIISMILNIAVFFVLARLDIEEKMVGKGYTKLNEMYVHILILFIIFYSFGSIVLFYHLFDTAPLLTTVSIVLIISIAEIIVELIRKYKTKHNNPIPK